MQKAPDQTNPGPHLARFRKNKNTKMITKIHALFSAKMLLTLGLAAVALAGTDVQAQTYTKISTGQDYLPATAQLTGTGALTTILGSFTTTSTASTASNPDLFKIYINGTSPFSATTVNLDTTVFDTQLFLFDASGAGVYSNDDASDFTKGSLLNPSVPVTPGFYFLGVSVYGAIPRSGTGAAADIFPNTFDDTTGDVGFTGLKTPFSGAGPLTNWSLSGADVETGFYSINLTGVSAAVPEASTALSFGLPVLLGLAMLTVKARRRAKQGCVLLA